ncbi:MAG: glycosyl transferase [Micavibrio sp.]|nr:glycosyl transferase [Micavibrio sp.]|tara:strand:- start:1257 stop:2330 length:1074 start_codon:yes stop_codon:yes gene_type:complete
MKIVHVMAGAEHGGAETAFVDMCIAMHEAGEDVVVVTRKNALRVKRLKDSGLRVHTLPFGSKLDFVTPLGLKAIFKRFKPDIVQCWMSRAAQMTPRWQAGFKCPQYITVGRLGSPYKLKYFKNLEYFVALTPDLATHLIEGGIKQDHITQIGNFAEVEPVETPLQRSDYNTPDNAPLILGLGRLHPDKAFDTLIKVADKLKDIHVWIAGEGPQRAELEALISTLKLNDRVKLLGWRSDRAALLKAADICAFISRNEGFGTVFVQSWAQQTPLVVCDSDGPRQFVRDGEDGLIAPIDDVEAIAAAINSLIQNPQYAETLCENGYQRYLDEFTKEQVVRRYLEFYKYIRDKENLSAPVK